MRSLILCALLAVPLGFVAAVTAPLHTPFLLNRFCPEGSKISSAWDRANYQGPTSSTLFVTCVNPSGVGVGPPKTSGGQLFALYYPLTLTLLLLFRGFLWIRGKRRPANQAPAA